MSDPANTRQFVAKNQSVILRAVGDATQAKVGAAMGHDAGYVSRFLKGEQKISFDELLVLVDVCGLAVHRLSEDDMIVSRNDWRMYLTLAKRHMEAMVA
jgi:hypothetical protein